MKILIVCEVASIHSAKWINQLKNTGWKVYVFQAVFPAYGINPDIDFGKIYYPGISSKKDKKVYKNTIYISGVILKYIKRKSYPKSLLSKIHNYYLINLIKKLKPDVIHSHGMHVNGNNLLEPVLCAKKYLGDRFTYPWLYSTWGSDLDYYAKLKSTDILKVRSILNECNYLTTECKRDLELAKKMGFKGKYIGFMPVYGGVNIAEYNKYYQNGKVSDRRIILLKGRDSEDGSDPIGKAMTAIKATILCKEKLKKYKIIIFQAAESIINFIEKNNMTREIDYEILPYIPYNKILEIMGKSRIFISITINDGLPASLVEAMSLGAFPIHSDLASVREWIKDGDNGLLVKPEDHHGAAEALKKALMDDDLVNKAAMINKKLIKDHLSNIVILPKTIEMYKKIAERRL